MIPKEIKYNLLYADVRGDFLRLPHGTTSFMFFFARTGENDPRIIFAFFFQRK